MPAFPDIGSKEVLDTLVKNHRKEQDRKRERVSAIEHEQWCYWSKGLMPDIEELLDILSAYMDVMHSTVPSQKCKEIVYEGSTYQPRQRMRERMERWKRLHKTAYTDLTEAEKDDDRVWADKALAVIDDSAGRGL